MVVNWLVGFCSLVFILCWRRLIPLSVLPENHLTPPPSKKTFHSPSTFQPINNNSSFTLPLVLLCNIREGGRGGVGKR